MCYTDFKIYSFLEVNMKININEDICDFKLVSSKDVKEINSVCHIFNDNITGAKLLYLENDDSNKVFGIGFRTPPNSSKGICHIIEHSVLSGSKKYRTKEPFMDLLKGSLQTFLNAMTFSDKTIYPVASRNDKDFYNLMDVYLDSVFNPLIAENKKIFMQEGWHYEILDKDSPITYTGVVYNEMKGAFSTPISSLYYEMNKFLFKVKLQRRIRLVCHDITKCCFPYSFCRNSPRYRVLFRD